MTEPKQKSKYELLDQLLGLYGTELISEAMFWHRMRHHHLSQDDIDWYCDERARREQTG